MQGDDLKVTDGPSAGAWIKLRLGGEFGAVTLEVPEGYEAYARVFHPASDSDLNLLRWSQVADLHGKAAHRGMQWHAIVDDPDPVGDPSLGEMDPDELVVLCKILGAHTPDSDNCFFGLCTIQGWEDQFAPRDRKHLLSLPMDRDYIVLNGPLSAVDQIVFDTSKPSSSRAISVAHQGENPPAEPDPSHFRRRQAPNLIWSEDRSWLMASEVDFDSTLVGGSAELIEAIVASPELEAWKVEPTDSLAFDADTINTAEEGSASNGSAI